MSHVDDGLLHAWLDDELDERRAGEIEEHVAICARCDDLLEKAIHDHARAAELVAAADAEALDAPAWQELLRRARQAEAREDPARAPRAAEEAEERLPSLLVPGLAWAATLVLAFFLGWQASQRSETPGPEMTLETRRAPVAPAPEQTGPGQPEQEVAERLADRQSPPPLPQAEPAPERVRPAAQADETARPAEEQVEERAERRSEPPVVQAEPQRLVAVPERVREEARSALSATEEERLASSGAWVDAAATAPSMGRLARFDRVAGIEAAFRSILPSQAASWLGVEPLRFPGADLRGVAVGPGDALSGLSGRPVLRAIYDDTGSEVRIVLLQQSLTGPLEDRLPPRPERIVEIEPQPRMAAAESRARRLRADGDGERDDPESDVAFPPGLDSAVLTVRPDGTRALRWSDPRGYLVVIEAPLSEARLRELAATLQ